MGYESAEEHDINTNPSAVHQGTKPLKDMLVAITLAFIGVAMAALLALGVSGCSVFAPPQSDIGTVLEDAGNVAQDIGSVYRFENETGRFVCSAVAISPKDLLLAAHCVLPQSSDSPLYVRHLVGERLAVRVVDVADGLDLAKLELVDAADAARGKAGKSIPIYARIAPYPPRLGEPVVTIGWGCLDGHAPLTSPGLVTFVPGDESITVGVKICPGDSGGGLFNRGGELLGITSLTADSGGFPRGVFVQVAGSL